MSCISPPTTDITLELALDEVDDAMSPTVISAAQAPWDILHVNEAWTKLCGYTEHDARGAPFSILQGPKTDMRRARAFFKELREENQAECSLLNYSKNGRSFLHCISSRRITDPTTGNAYFVTHSHEGRSDHERPQCAPLMDVIALSLILFTVATYLLAALSGSAFDEYSYADPFELPFSETTSTLRGFADEPWAWL